MKGDEKMKKRNKIAIVSVLAIAIIASAGGFITHITQAQNSEVTKNVGWSKIGIGNLQAEEVNGKWLLHSSPAVYLNMLGIQGKEYKNLSNDVYELTGDVTTELEVNKKESVEMGQSDQKIIKSGDKVFNALSETQLRLSSGNLIIGDPISRATISIIDSNGGSESLISVEGMNELKNEIAKLRETREAQEEAHEEVHDESSHEAHENHVVWADPAGVVEDDLVIYYSNKNSVKDNFSSLSIYAVSAKDKTDKLIMDATQYGEGVEFVGAAKNTVVGYLSMQDALLVYDTANGNVEQIPFNGYPDSLSPDGNTLLFRNITNHVVDSELQILDLKSGAVKMIGMPEEYFYNMVGAWSKNGDKFAFYMNGKNGNDSNKAYRTNVKIGVVDVKKGAITAFEKPDKNSNLYTLGSISWIGNYQVVANTDDNYSWSLKVE